MFMLQRGLPVNDICYFIGEDVPKMTGTRIPSIPDGYSFDYINAEVIMNRLTVKDGRMILPDGMSYKLMVLPPLKTMRPELLRKIKQLTEQGACIVGPAPENSPSLQNFPSADEEIKSLSAELWGKTGDYTGQASDYNKGKIWNVTNLQPVLDHIGLAPDVSVPENLPILWIHRRLEDTDIYFITNQGESPVSFEAAFRVSGRKPELWDATNGIIRELPAYTQNDKIATVPLKLDSYGSAFIVFRKDGNPSSKIMEDNFPEPKTIVSINTPWEVRFDKLMRGPENSVKMTDLQDWSESSYERIKYYSGKAVYKNSIIIEKIPADETIFLNLGRVSVMAEIRINGQKAGAVWTSPWQAEITKLLKPGENIIEVDVVNNWVNRLIGDSGLPEKERKTWINLNQIKRNDPLQPSGLLGPVRVLSFRYK